MFELVILIIVIMVIGKALEMFSNWLGEIFAWVPPLYFWIIDNSYLIAGIICFVGAFLYLIYFKPHKAEKYFIEYKNDRLTRNQAITKIADTMYKTSTGIPSALNSKLTEKRIKALRKRVQAEESFINDLKSYIRTKES